MPVYYFSTYVACLPIFIYSLKLYGFLFSVVRPNVFRIVIVSVTCPISFCAAASGSEKLFQFFVPGGGGAVMGMDTSLYIT